MFVNDVKYKDNINKIYNTFSPLNWLLNIFSLKCSGDKENPLCSYFVMIRCLIPATICSINIFTLYYKVTCYYKKLLISVMYTDEVQMVYDIFQYLVDLYFVYKYGSKMFSEYIKQYAYIDECLGRVYNTNIKRQLIKLMFLVISMWISSTIYDYVIWVIGFGVIATSAFSIAYVNLFLKILTNLYLTVNVMHIESRLRVMGDLIKECYCTSPNCSSSVEDTVSKNNWLYSVDSSNRKPTKLSPMKSISCLNWNEVKCLSSCYLLLTEQVKYINRLFGIRLLLNCLSLLIDMVRFTNLAVRILMGSQRTGYVHEYYPALSALWRTLTCVTAIVSLVDQCESAYRQRERIICLIDHLIIEKTLDEKLLESLTEFRGLIQSRPINFHMAYFMKLDYSLLVSITSVYVTYTIILLQSV